MLVSSRRQAWSMLEELWRVCAWRSLGHRIKKKKDKGIDNYYLCAQAKRQELSGLQVHLSLKRENIKCFSHYFTSLASILSDP